MPETLKTYEPRPAEWQENDGQRARGDHFHAIGDYAIGVEEQEAVIILRVYSELPIEEHFKVEVWKPAEKFGGKLSPADVNWQALGSVSPAIATAASQAIAMAATMARQINQMAGL